jgi:hypothetical protein
MNVPRLHGGYPKMFAAVVVGNTAIILGLGSPLWLLPLTVGIYLVTIEVVTAIVEKLGILPAQTEPGCGKA